METNMQETSVQETVGVRQVGEGAFVPSQWIVGDVLIALSHINVELDVLQGDIGMVIGVTQHLINIRWLRPIIRQVGSSRKRGTRPGAYMTLAKMDARLQLVK